MGKIISTIKDKNGKKNIEKATGQTNTSKLQYSYWSELFYPPPFILLATNIPTKKNRPCENAPDIG